MYDAIRQLVEDYRHRCLWFLREDYMPAGAEEISRTLDLIERYGDRDAFRRTAEVREWLSRLSKPVS